MAPWHRNNPSGKACLVVLAAAAFMSICFCWAIQKAFTTITEALP